MTVVNPSLADWIPSLAGRRVLVVGDVILDEYLTGTATRLSREAPIPVLEFESRRHIPGGAANPAANIAALGSTAVQIGVIGADAAGEHLRTVLANAKIDPAGLIIDPDRPTTVKTRIMAHMGLRFPQQVARMDVLSRAPISEAVERQICEKIQAQLEHGQVDAILFSDYQTGLITRSLTAEISELVEKTKTPVLLAADAQGKLEKYNRFALVKCNADEARDWMRQELRSNEDFAAAARHLRAELALTGAMAITRGGDGITLALADDTIRHCPAPHVTDVYDTVGAGDTTIAVMTLAACAGIPYDDAAMLANYASGIVVRRVGNYAPTPEELRGAIDEN